MIRLASAPWPLKVAYAGLLASSAAAAATGLALLVALAGLRRLSARLDPFAVLAWFWYFRADQSVGHWLAVGSMVSAVAAGLVAVGLAKSLRPPLHGAARWATEAELRKGGLRARQGIVIGRKGGRLLISGSDEHVLLYAPTRAGKGVGVVIPNLLAWPDSAVVLDVKRENWEATAGFRAGHGQEVLLFDPLEPEGRTKRFNPLGHIDRTDADAVLDELQKLAVMLFPAPLNADPFWAEAARTGFIGVGALVAATPGSPFSLGAIYHALTEGSPRTQLPKILDARKQAGQPLSEGSASAICDFCSASENTFASIKQTITARMNLWLNPRVCAATEASDFDLRDLRERRMSLYLTVSPDNLARVAPLYNLLLQQLIDLNTRERPTAERHTIPVLMLLDEFARLGHAAVIAQAFAYVAGYGLRLLPVLQSPAQLRAEYGHDVAEGIIANCGLEIAFAPKELKVAQDLSERLGFYTYAGRAFSSPRGLSPGRHSQTDSDQRRALMMPQELIQMAPGHLIVLRAGLAPILGRKIVYWRERAFKARLAPPPTLPPRPLPPRVASPLNGKPSPAAEEATEPNAGKAAKARAQDLVLALPDLDLDALEPLPDEGADRAEVEARANRYSEAASRRARDGHRR